MYSYDEAIQKSIEYFNGDELAANVFVTKYALRDNEDNILESTPDEMHRRLAKEFARIEKNKFKEPLSEDEIYEMFKGFKYICVDKNTWITTSEGAKQVKDLIGKHFIALVDGKLYRSTKEGFFSTGIQNTLKITTKEGYSIIVTDNHPILKYDRLDYWLKIRKTSWIKAKDLQIGDKVVIHKHIGNFWFGNGTKSEGWIVGNLIGDGSFSSDKQANLVFYNNNEFEKALFLVNTTLCNDNQITGNISTKLGRYTISCNKIALLANKFGVVKGDKFNTELIEQASYDFCCGFISGLFDADGSVNKGKDVSLRLTSIHKELLECVQRILLRIGIVSDIYFRRKAINKEICGKKCHCKEYYDLRISKSNLNIFINKIGFTICQEKQEKIQLAIQNLQYIRNEKFDATISKIEQNGVQEVYDCTIPQIEAFDGNGFYLHNCPQGSPMYGIGNNYQTVSISNCFFLEVPLDSYNSIMDVDKQLVNISKRRGGCGIDLSKLRPRGARTHNAAHSSTGIISWMERYSHSIREVGQNNRRGALMLTLSVHHPDIIDFITVKKNLTKVTGANISVRLTQEFLNAVENDTDYELRFPVDSNSPIISKQVSARNIWNIIVELGWLCAEPGLVMWDNVLKGPADCYKEYVSMGLNPCCFSVNQGVWVITKSGYKELKTITNNDLIWCSYNREWKKTSGYFTVGKHQTYKVVFDNGMELIVTKNHRFGKYDEKQYCKTLEHKPILTELENLSVGDYVYVNNVDPITSLLNFTMVSGHYGYEDFWTQIESIEPYGIEDVGCIEVEDLHYFSANGIISGNSEITLSELDSCRLLCINLFSFVDKPFTKRATFNYEKFTEYAVFAQRLMDDIVDLESEKIDAIIKKIDNDPESKDIKRDERKMWMTIKKNNDEGRRTGTGITAIGDTLAALNIKYGSKESINIIEEIYKTLKLACYTSSVEMSKELGPFKCWNHELEKDCEFLLRIKDECPKLYKDMNKYGRRNIALLTTAPTGSTSLLTQTTSGIEPLFKLEPYIRRRKLTDDNKDKPDFIDKTGDRWKNYEVWHDKIKMWMDVTGETDINKSPWYESCANDIDWVNRVKIQAVAQKHVCHSISSTINLPNNVSKDTIDTIYRTAFNSGCKGITVYREGSRDGVLISKNKIEFPSERPKELPCDVHHITIKGQKYFILVGLIDGRPYEVFAGKNGILSSSIKTGTIIRKKKGFYKAVFDNQDELSPIVASVSEMEECISRLTSGLLRTGADMHFIVKQLERVGEKQAEMHCFSRSVARALKKYIPDGTKEGGECPECGKESLIRQEGCLLCCSCGASKCN